jgi:hypothetical protein
MYLFIGTIEKSCKDLFEEEIDRDELSVLIWKNKVKSVGELQVRYILCLFMLSLLISMSRSAKKTVLGKFAEF